MSPDRMERLKAVLGYDGWPRDDVGQDRVFVWNFGVSAADVPEWVMVANRRNCLPNGLCLARTTWRRRGGGPDDLLLVETYECLARRAARSLTIEFLAQFHVPRPFARVATAPAGVELVDADEANTVLTVGNLVVRVSPGGAPVVPSRAVAEGVASQVVARPDGRPAAARLLAPSRPAVVGDAIAIGDRPDLRRDDVDGGASARPYAKYFSRGGDVEMGDQAVVFGPDEPGQAEVESYLVDDEGGVRAGRFSFTVEDRR